MTPADFNLRQLRALAETVRLGSFTAAAKAVGISQPAVTQAVARLEALTGRKLIERGTAGILPTDAGILLGARADAVAVAMAGAFRPIRSGGAGGKGGAERAVTMAQLTALVALAEQGSYAAGAQALGIALPSLHRSVGELEKLAEVGLVERRGRGVALTTAGERMAAAFRLALGELRAAVDEQAVLAGRDQGAIRIGAHPDASHLLTGVIARFLAEHPPVTVEVEAAGADGIERLRGGRVDAVIALNPRSQEDIAIAPLADDPLVVAARAGHALGQAGMPGLVRLARFGWVLPPPGSDRRAAFDGMFLDGGLYAPSPGVTCPDAVAALELVAGSDLLTIASKSAVERGDHLIAIGAPLPMPRTLALVTRVGWAPTPAQATFLEEIRAAAAILSF